MSLGGGVSKLTPCRLYHQLNAYQEIKSTQDQLRAGELNEFDHQFRAEMDDLILKAYDAFEKCVRVLRVTERG